MAQIDNRSIRDDLIPLPGFDDGYSRIMLVGTTGAGKTTLLRQLIGTHPNRDRFPSISTAKTTTAEYEIVTAPAPYQAVITFRGREQVQAEIEECVEEAAKRAVAGESDKRIAEALLEHPEQRFRLRYILGDWEEESRASDAATQEDSRDDWDLLDDETDGSTADLDSGERLDDEEIQSNRDRLREFITELKSFAESVDHDLVSSRGSQFREIVERSERASVMDEIVIPIIQDDPAIAKLSGAIVSAVAERFSGVDEGDFEAAANDPLWQQSWYFEAADRESFLSQVRWFSSNHKQQFGRLLTPIVDGIRVRGPFYPSEGIVSDNRANLVLIDGQGLGHTAREAGSISSSITERFMDVDLIMLVDNAQQPMQAAPIELLRTAAQSGHGDKLAVAFTHFDEVKGDNLRTPSDKRAHVTASLDNAVSALQDESSMSRQALETVQTRLHEQAFFLANVDKAVSGLDKRTKSELGRLFPVMLNSGALAADIDLSPAYSFTAFHLALRDAADRFKTPWLARLGLARSPNIDKEHWTRVKAMSRRMTWGEDEYQELRPVADFRRALQDAISANLDQPISWSRVGSDDEKRAVTNRIRQNAFGQLLSLGRDRLVRSHKSEWDTAYEEAGEKSSYRRADIIGQIQTDAAPSIGMDKDKRMLDFLDEIEAILRESIEAEKGSLS